ncbi:MAG: hypothetical protein C5B57_07935 [Blastocatellia bacterium]|nr:MAG: hypothetical protein C5B57_07935 [Blastocatellia bacterium]
MEVAADRISIILIAVGPDRIVARALNSALRQRIPHAELIVVHDRTQESSVRRRLTGLNERMATFVPAGRLSPGAARNAGVRESTGSLFAIFDGSERLEADYLEVAKSTLTESERAAFATGLGFYSPIRPRDRGVAGDLIAPSWILAGPWSLAVTTVIRRDAFDLAGGFDPSLPALVEWDFLLTLIEIKETGVLVPTTPARDSRDDVRLHEALRPERYLPSVRRIFAKHRSIFEVHPASVLVDRDATNRTLWLRERQLAARRDQLRSELNGIDDQLGALRTDLRKHGRRSLEFGDLRRISPISRNWGLDRGRPIDRYYIESFIAEQAEDIRGTVLEVLDSFLTVTYGGDRVTRSDVLDIDPRNHRATVVADLRNTDQLPSEKYDCFILTQTLHLIDDMASALTSAFRALRPGGVLLATLPSVSMAAEEYGATGDHWRGTEAAARWLFETVFPPSHVAIRSRGNILAATAFLFGLSCDDVEERELESDDPGYPVLITIRAVKPLPPKRIISASRRSAAILLYHRIASREADVHRLAVTPDAFRSQMRQLSQSLRVMPLAEIAEAASSGEPPEGSVALTFDDGYLDNLENAAPILAEFGLPATFFVTTEPLTRCVGFWWDVLERVLLVENSLPERLEIRVGGQPFVFTTADFRRRKAAHDELYSLFKEAMPAVRDDVLRQLSAATGLSFPADGNRPMLSNEIKMLSAFPRVEIGAHGVHHLALPGLTPDDRHREVFECRSALERILERPITSFAYPFGELTADCAHTVLTADYRFGLTCEPRPLRSYDCPHRLPRLSVHEQTGSEFIESIVAALRCDA